MTALVLWRVVVAGVTAYYVERMETGDEQALEQVLTWQPNHPKALYQRALRLLSADPEAGLGMLARVYEANPTDPNPLILAASVSLEAGRIEDADALIRIADRLAPADPRVQDRLALYWRARDKPLQALQHLSDAMSARRKYQRGTNYPVLLQLAEDPLQRALLRPLAAQEPAWWADFFVYAAKRAHSTDSVRYLMALRRSADAEAATEAELVAYQNRLLRDGAATDAYLSWLNALDEDARKALGLVFNGGFELPISNSAFGWRVTKHQQLEIRPLRTLGTSGRASLMVRFGAFDQRFRHLAQRLLLQPGTYRLSGMARVNDLETKGGVRWQVRCQGADNKLLGESKVFLGAADWGRFSFDFEVPTENCDLQELRLVSAGKHGFELKIDGVLWLDDLQIARTDGLDAAARAEALLGQ
jgi:hypothetical protein